MPRISVLMPVRDAGPYLTDALDSVLAQTEPDLELIAVDDGSSDATGERLQALAARRPEAFRCHALASNRGKAEAVREGMRLALAERGL